MKARRVYKPSHYRSLGIREHHHRIYGAAAASYARAAKRRALKRSRAKRSR